MSANQELMSMGFTNAFSGFFACIPGSGSFSRSALNFASGAQTLYASVWNGVFVAVIFLAFAPWARFLPLASLAAVLFVIAYDLVDWRGVFRMREAAPSDFWIAIVTFVATLTIPLAYSVFVGIGLNLLLYLRRAGVLELDDLGEDVVDPLNAKARLEDEGIHVVQFSGELFYAVADQLEDRLSELVRGPWPVVLLRFSSTPRVDATSLAVLDRFGERMAASGRHVLFCAVEADLLQRFRAYGLVDRFGEDHFFGDGEGKLRSSERALERARVLAKVEG